MKKQKTLECLKDALYVLPASKNFVGGAPASILKKTDVATDYYDYANGICTSDNSTDNGKIKIRRAQ